MALCHSSATRLQHHQDAATQESWQRHSVARGVKAGRWGGRGDKIFAAVLADADAEGRIDWSMVSVDSTSCRSHQHAAGARRRPPRVSGKEALPGTTAQTRDSDAPGAA
jgi:hypothetical protein